MKIRSMQLSDIEVVLAVGPSVVGFDMSTGKRFWSREVLEAWCASESDLMLIAEEDGAMVGFVFFACHIPTGKATLENLWVAPPWRNQGIGKLMIRSAVFDLRQLGCKFIVALTEQANAPTIQTLGVEGFDTGKTLLWLDRQLP